jgi:hypothetical protein
MSRNRIRSIRKTTALVTAAALIGTGGLTAAQAATSSGTDSANRPGHRHGGALSTTQLAAIAGDLGVTTAQLRTALQASKPAKPVDGAARGAGMATALAAALDTDVAKVREILDANRPAKPARASAGTPKSKPSNTKLIAALAGGLDLDAATVKAAFAKIERARKAEHDARQAAMHAAVAAQLNLGADAVKAAFEANRPAKAAR